MAASTPAHASPARSQDGIIIDEARSLTDYLAVERIQADVWSQPTTVPSNMLIVAAETGGNMLVARHKGEVVGFSMGVPAFDGERVWLWSHMAAVDRGWQGRRIGGSLKRAQRAFARERGYPVITWTFDPLEARNANFNLVQLGAVARRFMPNHYGVMDDALNRGLPSDRFLAEWWVADDALPPVLRTPPSEDGEVYLAARRGASGLPEPVVPEGSVPSDSAPPGGGAADGAKATLHRATAGTAAGPAPSALRVGRPQPAPAPLDPGFRARGWGVIEIPLDFQGIKQADMELAAVWRGASAQAFARACTDGAVFCGFERDRQAGLGRYRFALGGVTE